MGEAMIAAALKRGVVKSSDVVVSDVAESRREALSRTHGVAVTGSNTEAVRNRSLIVLAVKPQEFANVAGGLSDAIERETTVLSIMAGVPIDRVRRELRHDAVARAMPNTAAAVGQAVSVWKASDDVSQEGRETVAALLGAMGKEIEVTDEAYLDMATAVSGSGPGYIFFLLESFIDAAVDVGLPRGLAEDLCVQTLLGSARLASETGKQPQELRAMVTSKGGTTAAGIDVFEGAGVRGTFQQAVAAARQRAKELAG
jgi:pyrroline-5-carboxylate reductase